MQRKTTFHQVLATALLLIGVAFGQNAFAESSWTIGSSYNPSTHKTKFTIKRSEYTYPQTVLYRTVGLSAYPGQHYTAVSGELNFTANDSIKEIEVTELNPNDNAYLFQNGSTRTYLFEVTDKGGFLLATKQRDMTTGTSVNNSSTTVFGEKELTIKSEQFTVTDDGYDQAYHSVNVNNYYSNSAPKNYFTAIGAQLRMTVTFDAREKNDGYQYIAIYANTSTSNVDTGDKNGNPGTIYYSRYMAGFTIEGNVNTTFYPYTFPVTSQGNNCGNVEHPWSGNPNGNLEQQYFNTNCRATDGRLIIPTDLSSLYVRFDASGDFSDDWYAKNVKAHIQAVDNTAPTMKGIVANPGRHAKGNTVYVSVAFSEIMTVTGTPTLSVYWGTTSGTLDYTSGSGSNVLTFKGIIPKTVSGKVSITGYDGTIQDLAGNDFSGSISYTDLFSTNADLAYALSDFRQDDNHNYLITCHDDLRGLAGLVNNGGDISGKTFRQVTNLTFPYSTQWNNSSGTENNFTCIGNSDHPFQGTYDGEGHTISGIRIYRDGEGAPNNYQGLFGKVSGIVKRVHLTNTRITGKSYVGGIAGETNSATIEECTVANNVCIHAVNTQSLSHGGVVGYNRGTVQSCISHATLSVTNTTNCSAYGGIAGRSSGSITDCLAIGATIPSVASRGAILGYREGVGSLTCNYYLNCTVAGTANATNVGFDGTDYFNGNSARALYALTLGAYIAIDHDPSATLPGSGNITYDNGADINGQPYSYNMASLNLTYNGNLPTGYHAIFTATAGTVNGNTLTMPASAVTVSSNFAVNTYSVRFKSNSSSATGSMANQGFTYGVAQPLTANNYSRVGYTFAGWNTQSNGNGTSYTDQQSVSNLTANHGETVDLYAQWEPISYTVHFDANYDNNGIVITGTMSDQNFIYNQTQSLAANAFEREGYIFIGWATQPDGMVDYTNGQPVSNLTYVQNGVVTLYAKWDLIYWTGDGSSVNPYLIIYPAQLMKLSEDVNYGYQYNDMFFKLGNNIDMDGVTFDGIGVNAISFRGVFDGDGNTISNLTINNPDDHNVGLFGSLENAIVRNVILDEAYVTGQFLVGAIVGSCNSNCTIENCLVINSSVTSNGTPTGIILGYRDNNNNVAVLTNNYYRNCSITIGGNTSTINIGTNDGDVAGARSVHTLTLPEQLIATSAETVTYDQVTYYASNVSVTLTPEIGYAISDVTVNGEAATNNGDGTWSFDMPAAAATVSATVNIKLPGTGEANNPYMISTTAQFDLVATLVNNGESYSGVYFKLADNANITVSNMIGTSEHPFSGNFDGNRSHNATLTLNLLFDTEVIYTAPFRYVSGANIHDLFVGGNMRIGNDSQYAASIVAYSEGTTILNNCVSNVEINSEANTSFAYNGGLVGHVASGSTLNITNCVFKGRVFYHNSGQCCGFVGLNEGTTNINGGIYEPSYQQLYSYYYYYNFINPDMGTYSLTDCYYTQPMGESRQGTIANTSVRDNLCHQISIAGETVYASPDDTFIDNVNDVYDYTGAVININPTVIFGGETLDPSCYTLSLTYNGNPATEVNARGNYLYTAAGVNANGYYGNVYRYFSVVGFDGSGTDSDPYLIESIEDWNKLASRVYDGTTYSGKHFKLMANLTISKVVGYNKINSFQGIFDGDGHTLTLNGDDFGTSGYYTSFNVCAPFRYVAGTTIKNLKVAGDIYTRTQYAGGLIGRAGDGDNVIQNCIVSVNIHSSISGDGTHGGFIAHLQGSNGALSETTFTGCAFTGSITTTNNTTNVGGFVGWCDWGNGTDNGHCRLFFNDCFINPSASCISEGSKTFARCNNEGESLHFNNGYFTQAIGDVQGKRVENDGALPIGSYTSYNVSGLKFYDNGVKDSDGTFFHNNNALSNVITREITGYGEGSGHWAFIASPIEGSIAPNTVTNLIGASIPETNPVAYDFDLYRLDPSDLMWENYHTHTADFNLVNGQGYLYATKETKTLTFTGTLNMGSEKTIAGLPNGYNLVGNPFCIEAYINKPYYTLDDNGAIIVANPVDKATPIQPCYGVIVKVENNEDIVFRTTEPFTNSNNGSLEMTLAQTVATRDGNALKTLDNAIISFTEGSQLGKFYFGTQPANIYIPQDGNDYAIAYSEGQGEMPLNFKAVTNGSYTLTVNPEGLEMTYLHLIDNLTGANIDLLQTPTYTFSARNDDYESRFRLIFSANNDNETEDGFAFISNGQLIITSEGRLQIIDMMGRVISTEVVNGTCSKAINLKVGLYVLQLINGENVKTQKIVIK